MRDPTQARKDKTADPNVQHVPSSPVSEYIVAASLILAITMAGLFVQNFIGYRAIALIYLMGVVVMALFIGRWPTLLAATLSALFWDFFFIKPITDFRISNIEDAILFATYFVVALVLGQLTARVRAQDKARRLGEERATALYLLTRELVEATDLDHLVQKVVQHIERAFHTPVVVLLPDASGKLVFQPHPASTYDITGPEQPIAELAFEQHIATGKFTKSNPQASCLFLPLLAGESCLGVLGLQCEEWDLLPAVQRNLLDAFCQHIALALDRHLLRGQSEQSRLLAESERLSKVLLNSVSHEIRTPLAAIQGAASNLLEIKDRELSPLQRDMVSEIQEASQRLDRLVGKVLDITRLESGRMKPKLDPCDIADLIHVSVKEFRKELARHPLTIDVSSRLPLVQLDFVLTQQVLTNLLYNAAVHTPAGTPVQITARAHEQTLVITVADRGPGIAIEVLPRIFDKFYRAPTAPTGGTGLGLSLVKGFVEAQGGSVIAENRPHGGALFTIRLPLGNATAASIEAPSD